MCSQWRSRTGDDPIVVTIEVKRIDRETQRWYKIPIYAFALLAVCVAAILMATSGSSPDVFGYWLIRAILPSLVLVIVITFYANHRIAVCDEQERSYAGRDSFGPDLSFFFNESGTRPEDYGSDEGLVWFREPAREILIKYCLAVVTLEKMDRKECSPDWGADVDAKRAKVKKVHTQLKRLRIVSDAFDEEYREAERRYEVAKKRSVAES